MRTRHDNARAGTRASRRPWVAAALAAIGVLGVFAGALAGVGALPSTAAEGGSGIDPGAVTAIEIHKFAQPDHVLAPATGLPQDTTGLTPVAGAVFTATLVPGIDLTTAAGQSAAAALTAEDAEALAAGRPEAARSTTDANGNASLSPLGVGVYLVEEVGTPAGYAPAVPFVVPLPLTDPGTRDGWMYTVHVYPKNAYAGVSLAVTDRNAVALGDAVAWESRSGIPYLRAVDGYRVVQRIDPRLALIGGAHGGTLSIACDPARGVCPTPVEGVDYAWTYDAATGELTVDFTAHGLALLAQAVATDPSAQVVIGYRTTVTAEGELSSETLLYASHAAIAGGPGAPAPVTDRALTKWGPLAIVVTERGYPDRLIPGATFRLYGSAADAAAVTDPIAVGGVSQWTTDAQGRIDISGLRFSGFVDGLERDPADPLYRYFYAVPVSFPSGYTGSTAALRAVVESTTQAQVLNLEVWRAANPGGLPVTGGQVPWALALVAGALIGAGVLVLVRRRREQDDRDGERDRP